MDRVIKEEQICCRRGGGRQSDKVDDMNGAESDGLLRVKSGHC